MKVRIHGRESFTSFVETVGDQVGSSVLFITAIDQLQLTALEHRLISSAPSQDQGLERFFWMWTAKEAYTKALGLGLGFDFRRIEFDPVGNLFRVDGVVPTGWQLTKFKIVQGADPYQGVVAEFVGGDYTTVVSETHPCEWLTVIDATTFIKSAIQRLSS
jgi:4'-phosphopantetheinyl transferase